MLLRPLKLRPEDQVHDREEQHYKTLAIGSFTPSSAPPAFLILRGGRFGVCSSDVLKELDP